MNRDSRPQDILFGAGRAVELVDDVALAQHQHAVAEAEQLGKLAGNHHDPDAIAGQFGDHPVYLRPGTDVDTASRLV